jgi:hypothetical protein
VPEKITRYDAPTRFIVPSSRPGEEPYLVELETHGLTGHCTCPQFQFRLLPMIAAPEGGILGAPGRCKHIEAARRQFAHEFNLITENEIDHVLRQYVKTQVPKETAKPWPPPEPRD